MRGRTGQHRASGREAPAVVLSVWQSRAYGKTREGVPYSAFFEGRRSLGSQRLKCSGFGLQHLWFCYIVRARVEGRF